MSPPILILASASPRRQRMLVRAGFDFSVRIPPEDRNGDFPGLEPRDLVLTQARTKAMAFQEDDPVVFLSADTVVVLGGRIMGKPSDTEAAVFMLTALSGRTHQVLTGFCLARDREVLEEEAVVTRVEFRSLSEAEIKEYVAGGSPLDKAGGYGIQDLGGSLVKEIHGSYTNVVGLPLAQVMEALARAGIYPRGINP